MHHWKLATAALLLTLSGAAQLAAQEPADTRPGLAVLPFAQGISLGPEQANLEALSVGLQQILITELAVNPALRVVDRSVLRDLMEEQDLGATGRVDAATAARVGRLVGARFVFTGGYNDVNTNFRLDGRVVDVETSEVVKAQQITGNRDDLYELMTGLATRLTEDLALPPLAPAVRQERQERSQQIPREAVVLYSQAQFFQDRGQLERARELYRRITDEFPRMTEAAEALQRIGTS